HVEPLPVSLPNDESVPHFHETIGRLVRSNHPCRPNFPRKVPLCLKPFQPHPLYPCSWTCRELKLPRRELPQRSRGLWPQLHRGHARSDRDRRSRSCPASRTSLQSSRSPRLHAAFERGPS